MKKLPTNFIQTQPNVLYWSKDTNSIFLNGNDTCVKAFGLRKVKDLIGINDHELPCKISELASIFQEQDKKVMITQKELKSLEILQCARNEWKILLVTKTPLIDEERLVTGISAYAIDVTKAFMQLNHFLLKSMPLTSKNCIIDISHSDYNNLKLSERQSEILFFLLRGLTVKKIAQIITLSPRTVEDHIEKLKSKFNCRTKSELVALSMDYGFMHVIPKKIFNRQLSIILD